MSSLTYHVVSMMHWCVVHSSCRHPERHDEAALVVSLAGLFTTLSAVPRTTRFDLQAAGPFFGCSATPRFTNTINTWTGPADLLDIPVWSFNTATLSPRSCTVSGRARICQQVKTIHSSEHSRGLYGQASLGTPRRRSRCRLLTQPAGLVRYDSHG